MANRVFKITMYVEADADNPDVLQETVESTVFNNRQHLIDAPQVLRVDRVSAEEISYAEYIKYSVG